MVHMTWSADNPVHWSPYEYGQILQQNSGSIFPRTRHRSSADISLVSYSEREDHPTHGDFGDSSCLRSHIHTVGTRRYHELTSRALLFFMASLIVLLLIRLGELNPWWSTDRTQKRNRPGYRATWVPGFLTNHRDSPLQASPTQSLVWPQTSEPWVLSVSTAESGVTHSSSEVTVLVVWSYCTLSHLANQFLMQTNNSFLGYKWGLPWHWFQLRGLFCVYKVTAHSTSFP